MFVINTQILVILLPKTAPESTNERAVMADWLNMPPLIRHMLANRELTPHVENDAISAYFTSDN